MRPPRALSGSSWADERRFVAVGTSPEPGRWKSRPHQREVLDAITDPAVEGVVYIACSQGGGKTEILLNAAGYYADHDPSPILIVEPNVEMAEALSKDRLAPMIRSSPALAGKVADSRTRDSGNTIRHKEFPGGHVTLVGANSASGLSMRPIRVVLFDEVDRYPPSAGTEGDPVELAEARTTAFWNARKFVATSPGRKGGRSWQFWQHTDQCEWHVPCPDCETFQPLRWEQVQWEKSESGEHLAETAVYVCERCGVPWSDTARWQASLRGRYVASNLNPTSRWRGFRFPAMGVVGRGLVPMVRKWLSAQGNPEQIKAFKNTTRADWWEEQYEAIDETGLMARREDFPEVGGRLAVPAACAVLTAGVDVQDNRLEISVYAWASGEESWCLAHDVLYGDPATPATWIGLDEYLRRPWPRELGGVDYLRGTCVDTGGHHTQSAYDFCGAPGRFRGVTPDGGRCFVFATRGSAGGGDLWPRAHSTATTKVPLWTLKVDAGKEQVYGRLSIVEHGAGHVHFPKTLGDEFFKGLTAEKIEVKTDRKGFAKRTWKLKRSGARNEPLDCAVLAYAALWGLRANGMDLETEVARVPMRQVYEPTAAAPTPDAAVVPQAETGRSRWQEKSKDWLGDTRGWLGR